MTNEEKINRLRELERCMPIHTKEDVRDFEALEGAIEAIETLGKIESRLSNVLKELEEGLLTDNRLIAVSGMSIEELADAFTNGYRLVGPEAFKSDIPADLRIVPKKPREQTRWIPISEGLPEENGYYLTTTMHHEVYCDCWEGVRFNRTEAVIAWMPLPQAYKAESEET